MRKHHRKTQDPRPKTSGAEAPAQAASRRLPGGLSIKPRRRTLLKVYPLEAKGPETVTTPCPSDRLRHQVLEELARAARWLQHRWPQRPQVGMILGSGLGQIACCIKPQAQFDFSEVPGLVPPTAQGHRGRLVCGQVNCLSTIIMQGRVHLYEGHPVHRVAFPVWLLRRLGCRLLLIFSAAGGLNPQLHEGEVVVLVDHINLMGTSPLVGLNHSELGRVFPDMSRPYWPPGVALAQRLARQLDLPLPAAVYAGMRGPNLETRAEYRFLRRIGADVVGMSTVPEVIAAAQVGLPVLAFAVVGNMCLPDALGRMTHEHILQATQQATDRLTELVRRLLTPQLLELLEEDRP